MNLNRRNCLLCANQSYIKTAESETNFIGLYDRKYI